MAQDIRNMIKDHKPENPGSLSQGHEARFAERLEAAFSEKKDRKGVSWWRIAAMIVAFVGVAMFAYFSMSKDDTLKPGEDIVQEDQGLQPETVDTPEVPQITLGDLSPGLKKVEDFYTNGINVQLASLEINDDNRELIDGYMERLGELDAEYQKLNNELNELGPSEATVNALINNLQLRLEMLFKLKNKLKELKDNENEQFNSTTA